MPLIATVIIFCIPISKVECVKKIRIAIRKELISAFTKVIATGSSFSVSFLNITEHNAQDIADKMAAVIPAKELVIKIPIKVLQNI